MSPNVQDAGTPSTEARAALYATLSGIFARELTQEGWTRLCNKDALELLRELAIDCGIEAEAAALLQCLAASHGRDPAATVEELAVDYARLFIGPGPGLAPPYESVYTSPTGRFYGEALSKVSDLLRSEGIQVGAEFGAPADHLAVELSIMRYLVERGAARAAESDPAPVGEWRRQLEFLEGHLLPWVPRWAADVATAGATDFYRSAAGMLEGYLRRDQAWLRRAIAGPTGQRVDG
ncbi:MAG TPA: molecular chaperone TorD family protein [bacterium]|nr:molecular chaperone TorD family protein [bacterium]